MARPGRGDTTTINVVLRQLARNTEGSNVHHIGLQLQDLFDPERRDVLASPPDRVRVAADEVGELVVAIQRATEAIVCGQRPVVGAINGWVVGGGFEWAINCDFRIWARGATGFFPEVSLNLFVTGAVTSLLPALVGLNVAREMLFFGARYDAEALPPPAVRSVKRVLNEVAAVDLRAALAVETEATVAGFMDPLTTSLIRDF